MSEHEPTEWYRSDDGASSIDDERPPSRERVPIPSVVAPRPESTRKVGRPRKQREEEAEGRSRKKRRRRDADASPRRTAGAASSSGESEHEPSERESGEPPAGANAAIAALEPFVFSAAGVGEDYMIDPGRDDSEDEERDTYNYMNDGYHPSNADTLFDVYDEPTTAQINARRRMYDQRIEGDEGAESMSTIHAINSAHATIGSSRRTAGITNEQDIRLYRKVENSNVRRVTNRLKGIMLDRRQRGDDVGCPICNEGLDLAAIHHARRSYAKAIVDRYYYKNVRKYMTAKSMMYAEMARLHHKVIARISQVQNDGARNLNAIAVWTEEDIFAHYEHCNKFTSIGINLTYLLAFAEGADNFSHGTLAENVVTQDRIVAQGQHKTMVASYTAVKKISETLDTQLSKEVQELDEVIPRLERNMDEAQAHAGGVVAMNIHSYINDANI